MTSLTKSTHSFHLMNSGSLSLSTPYWPRVMAFMSRLSNSTSDWSLRPLCLFCQATGFSNPSTKSTFADTEQPFSKSSQMVVDASAMSARTSFSPTTIKFYSHARRRKTENLLWTAKSKSNWATGVATGPAVRDWDWATCLRRNHR